MVKKDVAKRFSCVKCGAIFEVYPPDDIHHIASLKKNDIDDPIEMTCTCRNCGEGTVIYWGYQSMSISVG